MLLGSKCAPVSWEVMVKRCKRFCETFRRRAESESKDEKEVSDGEGSQDEESEEESEQEDEESKSEGEEEGSVEEEEGSVPGAFFCNRRENAAGAQPTPPQPIPNQQLDSVQQLPPHAIGQQQELARHNAVLMHQPPGQQHFLQQQPSASMPVRTDIWKQII